MRLSHLIKLSSELFLQLTKTVYELPLPYFNMEFLPQQNISSHLCVTDKLFFIYSPSKGIVEVILEKFDPARGFPILKLLHMNFISQTNSDFFYIPFRFISEVIRRKLGKKTTLKRELLSPQIENRTMFSPKQLPLLSREEISVLLTLL